MTKITKPYSIRKAIETVLTVKRAEEFKSDVCAKLGFKHRCQWHNLLNGTYTPKIHVYAAVENVAQEYGFKSGQIWEGGGCELDCKAK